MWDFSRSIIVSTFCSTDLKKILIHLILTCPIWYQSGPLLVQLTTMIQRYQTKQIRCQFLTPWPCSIFNQRSYFCRSPVCKQMWNDIFPVCTPLPNTITPWTDLDSKWVRLAPNGTNPGIFQIRFSTFWLGDTKMGQIWDISRMYNLSVNLSKWSKMVLKSPRFVLFGICWVLSMQNLTAQLWSY